MTTTVSPRNRILVVRPRAVAVIRRLIASTVGMVLVLSVVASHRVQDPSAWLAFVCGLGLTSYIVVMPRSLYWDGDSIGITGLISRRCRARDVRRVEHMGDWWQDPVAFRRHSAYRVRDRGGGTPIRTDSSLWRVEKVAELMKAAGLKVVEVSRPAGPR